MANVREAIKWIDGNTNYATPVYDSPRFNVDDPTFSLPMPVISGLASGYCERRAVLNPVFPTGAATTADWTTDDTTKERIVNNVAQNLALGVTGATLSYDNTTAAFNPVAPLATANNYMTAMDAAITSLVFGGTADPVYKRNANGASYGNTAAAAFTTLATDAQATAADTAIATSAIALPVSGGTNYSVAMNLGLPVAWAKERKWMLDELRYTGMPLTTVTTLGDMTANYISAQVTVPTKSVVSTGYDTWGAQGYPPIANLSGTINAAQEGNIAYYIEGALNNPPATGAIQINVYLGTEVDDYDIKHVDYSSLSYVTGATNAVNGGNYCVLAGGTLTATNVSLGTVVVESGAKVIFGANAAAYDLHMFPGAELGPYVNGGYVHRPCTDGFIFRFSKPAASWMHEVASCTYIENATYTIPQTTNPTFAWIAAGGSANVANTSKNANVYASGISESAALVTIDNGCGTYRMVVDNYATATIASGGSAETTVILSGGVLINNGTANTIEVESGGTLIQASSAVTSVLQLKDYSIVSASAANAAQFQTMFPARVEIHLYSPMGLFGGDVRSDPTPGWHVFNPVQITGTTYAIAGNQDRSEALAVISAYVQGTSEENDIRQITKRVLGQVVIGGTTMTDVYTAFAASNTAHTSTTIGATFEAKNRKAGGAGYIDNHYENFRVRQWETDPVAT